MTRNSSLKSILLIALLCNILSLMTIVYKGILLSPHIDNKNENVATKGQQPATTGQIFAGQKIRSYTGGFKLAAMKGVRTSKGGSFPRLTEDCEKWAVVTTIFEPTEAIHAVAKLEDWCMIIVGDSITPDRSYRKFVRDYQGSKNGRIVYLSLNDQKRLRNTFVETMPIRHFARKNIGYLFAIRHGARTIFDYDDDNVLLQDAFGKPIPPLVPFASVYILVRFLDDERLDGQAFNPYPLMNSTVPDAWPRGFPLEEIKNPLLRGNESNIQFGSVAPSSIGVIQAVADGDPDVDAIYRLTRELPFSFDNRPAASKLLIPVRSYASYNAQATVHLHQAFWGMLLPMTVTGRVSDIWRSYFTQRIMQDLDLSVLYIPKMVNHQRNQHSYMADMDAEDDLYRKTAGLIRFLTDWKEPARTSLPVQLEKLCIALYEHGYVGMEDVISMQEWLLALVDVGYEFPQVTSIDHIEKRLTPMVQSSLQLQPFLAYPYYNLGGPNNSTTYPQFLSHFELPANESTWREWLAGANLTSAAANNSAVDSIASVPVTKRPSLMVTKLILMTRDEWPLIQQWTLYHGELLGFEHLYIIDGSTDPRCLSFLVHARDVLGANVLFSPANLNELIEEMTFVGNMVRGSSDFTIKVDTDEYLTVKTNSSDCVDASRAGQAFDCTLSPYGVTDYLGDIEGFRSIADGRRLKIGYTAMSIQNKDLCEAGQGDEIGRLVLSETKPTNYKSVHDMRTFANYDLGGHQGYFLEPHSNSPDRDTQFGILHFHSRCLEHEISNCRKAVISHGYIAESDTPSEALRKLESWFDKDVCNATQEDTAKGASYHKVWFYARHLACPDMVAQTFYPNAARGGVNFDFANYLDRAMEKYGAI